MAATALPPGTRKAGRTTALRVVATGTASDVLPYVALGVGLQQAGFIVTVVSHGVHAGMVAHCGLGFAALRGDPQAVMGSTAFRDAVATENVLGVASLFKSHSDAVVPENCTLIHAACKDADGIICSYSVLTECSAVAQKYQIPAILAPLLPFSPTGEIPVAVLMPKSLNYSWLNKLTYDLSGWLLWTAMGAVYNRFRTGELRIGPQAGFELDGVAQVTAFSDVVVPRPHDWGSHIHMTGCWHLPPALAASRMSVTHRVLSALVASPPSDHRLRPICIAFDCVPIPDVVVFLQLCFTLAQRYSTTVILVAGATDMDAARSSVVLEAIPGVVWEMEPVYTGGGGASAGAGRYAGAGSLSTVSSPSTAGFRSPGTFAAFSPAPATAAAAGTPSRPAGAGAAPTTPGGGTRPSILVTREVPWSWLLPACSLVIHHGGAEVTQAAMAAGIPSAAFPAFGEQYFWAARICLLGAGPLIYYPFRHVMTKLPEIVAACRLPDISGKAAGFGSLLRSRGDGVAAAVGKIRDILSRPQHRHCGVTCTWAPDSSSPGCTLCDKPFTMTQRRRHCRSCGRLACGDCLSLRCHLPGYPETAPQITCTRCLDSRTSFLAMHTGKSALPEPATPAGGGGGGMGGDAVTDVPLDSPFVSPAGALTFTSPMSAVSAVPPDRGFAGGPVASLGSTFAASLSSPAAHDSSHSTRRPPPASAANGHSAAVAAGVAVSDDGDDGARSRAADAAAQPSVFEHGATGADGGGGGAKLAVGAVTAGPVALGEGDEDEDEGEEEGHNSAFA